MKHKNGIKGRRGYLVCIYTKEMGKILLYLPPKSWKCPFYKALKEKRKYKTDEKGRGG